MQETQVNSQRTCSLGSSLQVVPGRAVVGHTLTRHPRYRIRCVLPGPAATPVPAAALASSSAFRRRLRVARAVLDQEPEAEHEHGGPAGGVPESSVGEQPWWQALSKAALLVPLFLAAAMLPPRTRMYDPVALAQRAPVPAHTEESLSHKAVRKTQELILQPVTGKAQQFLHATDEWVESAKGTAHSFQSTDHWTQGAEQQRTLKIIGTVSSIAIALAVLRMSMQDIANPADVVRDSDDWDIEEGEGKHQAGLDRRGSGGKSLDLARAVAATNLRAAKEATARTQAAAATAAATASSIGATLVDSPSGTAQRAQGGEGARGANPARIPTSQPRDAASAESSAAAAWEQKQRYEQLIGGDEPQAGTGEAAQAAADVKPPMPPTPSAPHQPNGGDPDLIPTSPAVQASVEASEPPAAEPRVRELVEFWGSKAQAEGGSKGPELDSSPSAAKTQFQQKVKPGANATPAGSEIASSAPAQRATSPADPFPPMHLRPFATQASYGSPSATETQYQQMVKPGASAAPAASKVGGSPTTEQPTSPADPFPPMHLRPFATQASYGSLSAAELEDQQTAEPGSSADDAGQVRSLRGMTKGSGTSAPSTDDAAREASMLSAAQRFLRSVSDQLLGSAPPPIDSAIEDQASPQRFLRSVSDQLLGPAPLPPKDSAIEDQTSAAAANFQLAAKSAQPAASSAAARVATPQQGAVSVREEPSESPANAFAPMHLRPFATQASYGSLNTGPEASSAAAPMAIPQQGADSGRKETSASPADTFAPMHLRPFAAQASYGSLNMVTSPSAGEQAQFSAIVEPSARASADVGISSADLRSKAASEPASDAAELQLEQRSTADKADPAAQQPAQQAQQPQRGFLSRARTMRFPWSATLAEKPSLDTGRAVAEQRSSPLSASAAADQLQGSSSVQGTGTPQQQQRQPTRGPSLKRGNTLQFPWSAALQEKPSRDAGMAMSDARVAPLSVQLAAKSAEQEAAEPVKGLAIVSESVSGAAVKGAVADFVEEKGQASPMMMMLGLATAVLKPLGLSGQPKPARAAPVGQVAELTSEGLGRVLTLSLRAPVLAPAKQKTKKTRKGPSTKARRWRQLTPEELEEGVDWARYAKYDMFHALLQRAASAPAHQGADWGPVHSLLKTIPPQGLPKYDALRNVLHGMIQPPTGEHSKYDLVWDLLKRAQDFDAQLGFSKYDPIYALLNALAVEVDWSGVRDPVSDLIQWGRDADDWGVSKYDPIPGMFEFVRSHSGFPPSKYDPLPGVWASQAPDGRHKADPLTAIFSLQAPAGRQAFDPLQGLLRMEIPTGDAALDPLPAAFSVEPHAWRDGVSDPLEALWNAEAPSGRAGFDPLAAALALEVPAGDAWLDPLPDLIERMNAAMAKHAEERQAQRAQQENGASPAPSPVRSAEEIARINQIKIQQRAEVDRLLQLRRRDQLAAWQQEQLERNRRIQGLPAQPPPRGAASPATASSLDGWNGRPEGRDGRPEPLPTPAGSPAKSHSRTPNSIARDEAGNGNGNGGYDPVPDLLRRQGAVSSMTLEGDPTAVIVRRGGSATSFAQIRSAFQRFLADPQMEATYPAIFTLMHRCEAEHRTWSEKQPVLLDFSQPEITTLRCVDRAELAQAASAAPGLVDGVRLRYPELHELLRARDPVTAVHALCALAAVLPADADVAVTEYAALSSR